MEEASRQTEGSQQTEVIREPRHHLVRLVPIFLLLVLFVIVDVYHVGKELRLDSKRLQRVPGFMEFSPDRSAGVLYGGAPWKSGVGRWLRECGGVSKPVFIKEDAYGEFCPGDCSRHGVCNHELGVCRCERGYKGEDCSELDNYPCNREPIDGFPYGVWIVSLCAAHCDLHTGRCVCGPGSKFPLRPVSEPCGFARSRSDVVDRTVLNRDSLYNASQHAPGWCNADPADMERHGATPQEQCFCNHDDAAGDWCEVPTLPFCFSQCSGRGACLTGFCQCEGGWYGIDCSIPSSTSALPAAGAALPEWLQVPADVPSDAGGRRALLGRQGLKDKAAATAAGGVAAPPPTWGSSRTVVRRRPLIYVYDLRTEFTTDQLQGRLYKYQCVPWIHAGENVTELNMGLLYGLEPMLLEALLASPHRTTNGDEADYFYVPVLGACMHVRADDSPRTLMNDFRGARPYYVADFYMRAYEYIRREYPFWERHAGKDHLWVHAWDEGACEAPSAIWSSIMISHWGNTMSKHNRSTTAYRGDDWQLIPQAMRGGHPCFDPAKDIVMPAWKPPTVDHLAGRLWDRPMEERPLLFYFNGNLGGNFTRGRPEAGYSMGIRQRVAELFASQPNTRGQLGRLAEPDVVVKSVRTPTYAQELTSAKFCGVFPGDGFSARMEDSVLHGCIPVIIQDGVMLPFENVMEYGAFAVRIAEDDIPAMIRILRRVSKERVQRMLQAVRGLWRRWSWLHAMRQQARRQKARLGFQPAWASHVEDLLPPAGGGGGNQSDAGDDGGGGDNGNVDGDGDDAVSTLVQVLHYKLHNDPWRREAHAAAASNKDYGVPTSCRR